MFSTERSDFAVPVTGYLLMAALFVMEALGFLYSGDWLDKNYADAGVMLVLSFILIIVGLISLWKAYIVDGLSFLFVGALIFAKTRYFVDVQATFIIIGVVFILIAAMALRAGDFLVLINDAIAGAGFIFFGFFEYNTDAKALALIAAICMVIAVIASVYICYNDWSLVQDIASDYQEALFEEGDDCCCCDDDNCDCQDGEECHCHDGECHCHDKENKE